jgi:DNA-binding PadR family transcriptional regulator
MSLNHNGRSHGWEKLAETLAAMVMNAGWRMRARWDEGDARGGAADGEEDDSWRGLARSSRRGRMFAPGELRLVLLALIADRPAHGYDLIKAIEEKTGGDYAPSPGAVYPTLQLLEDEGLIERAEAEGAKQPFAVTALGRKELEERKEEVAALMRRLGRHGERTAAVRSHDLFRALGNLGSVLSNRARAGKLDERAINAIIDMIDEMASRIERL